MAHRQKIVLMLSTMLSWGTASAHGGLRQLMALLRDVFCSRDILQEK